MYMAARLSGSTACMINSWTCPSTESGITDVVPLNFLSILVRLLTAREASISGELSGLFFRSLHSTDGSCMKVSRIVINVSRFVLKTSIVTSQHLWKTPASKKKSKIQRQTWLLSKSNEIDMYFIIHYFLISKAFSLPLYPQTPNASTRLCVKRKGTLSGTSNVRPCEKQ